MGATRAPSASTQISVWLPRPGQQGRRATGVRTCWGGREEPPCHRVACHLVATAHLVNCWHQSNYDLPPRYVKDLAIQDLDQWLNVGPCIARLRHDARGRPWIALPPLFPEWSLWPKLANWRKRRRQASVVIFVLAVRSAPPCRPILRHASVIGPSTISHLSCILEHSDIVLLVGNICTKDCIRGGITTI